MVPPESFKNYIKTIRFTLMASKSLFTLMTLIEHSLKPPWMNIYRTLH